jgi:hypothetical protein
VANITVVTATISSATATATCPAGTKVIGGGVTQTSNKGLRESGPVGTTGWRATYDANGSGATVTAYCAA